ncbi:uncharacterized protein TNIN_178121 [Trichonephila inaurata madagascariensis]|uniref:Gustatory receptor n=1 Tax=Trichonephila inaurata madagascariensis TaxID=2747483 RepID=A0A8X7CB18_9ARAC|nr:uncharacterized protein TNIN_178121 [Trichonephila inaurata madagascariensis]
MINSTIFFNLPAVIAVLSGTIYYKLSDFLESLAVNVEQLQSSKNPKFNTILKLKEQYNLLYKSGTEIEKTLSSTSFLLLSSQWVNLFVILITFVVLDSNSFSSIHIWECIPRLILVPWIIVGVVLCGARVSSQIHRIQIGMQLIHNNLECNFETNRKTIQLVKSIMATDFPKMTAFGIFTIKPGLILSIFGSVLTYGLLVLSIKKNNV